MKVAAPKTTAPRFQAIAWQSSRAFPDTFRCRSEQLRRGTSSHTDWPVPSPPEVTEPWPIRTAPSDYLVRTRAFVRCTVWTELDRRLNRRSRQHVGTTPGPTDPSSAESLPRSSDPGASTPSAALPTAKARCCQAALASVGSIRPWLTLVALSVPSWVWIHSRQTI